MTDFSDYIPLFGRSEAEIRADVDVRVNAALAIDDLDWVDTRAPGLFYLATQSMVVEAAKLWAALTEYSAAANLGTSWGEWLDIWAESFGLERLAATRATGEITLTGTNGTLIGSGAQVGIVQTDPDETPPTFVTTASGTIAGGTLTLAIEAVDFGTQGNIGIGAITLPLTPMPGVATITNAAATGGGTEPETDIALRDRLLLQFSGRGSGTSADYRRWALEYPGVGRVTVVPTWEGPGTVLVIVSTIDGDPVGGPVVAGLQAYLDPTPGQGAGRAPIGHTVTVQTITSTVVNVVATVTFESGFTLTGPTGVGAEIEAAIREYIDELEPGEDVIYNHVRAVFFDIEGVLDVPTLTLNAASANVVIAITPVPAVATTGTVTLT